MRIINIVDELSRVNFGIWNAAIAPCVDIFSRFGLQSELWYPQTDFKVDFAQYPGVSPLPLSDTSIQTLKAKYISHLDRKRDIIITHGAWRFPTRWGASLQNLGYFWMYVPHGMLEPWSMSHKRWKKWLYFELIEKKLAKRANVVRAVGYPEYLNLKKIFHNVAHITNGVPTIDKISHNKTFPPYIVLYLARLHKKKRVVPLVEAWIQSELCNNPNFELYIAGPDDGQLQYLRQFISNNKYNIYYQGAVYGNEKEQLLSKAHFYILPSISEGFPTSVIEAMQYGIVPIITEGCNFPEAFEHGMAIRTGTEKHAICQTLNLLTTDAPDIINVLSPKVQSFANDRYTNARVAELLIQAINKFRQ